MSTSLQQQLRKIAGSSAAVQQRANKKQVSFLYENSADAEQIDLETAYAMALNGLAELATYSDEFLVFERGLFSQRSKGIERLQLTNDEQGSLDTEIEDYLTLLSPYFLQRAAHKTLEYLIRKFRIHVHNVSAVLSSIILYHETSAFVRMVKIVELSLSSKKESRRNWMWLSAIQKEGRPLPKQAWVQQCISDPTLLLVVGETATLCAENKKATDTTPISFWASTVVSVIDRVSTVDEALVGLVLRDVVTAVTSRNTNYNAAGCIVLSALSARISIAQKPLQMLLKTIGKSITADNYKTSMICIAYICQSQTVTSLPTAVVEKVVDLDEDLEATNASVVQLFSEQLKLGGEQFLLLLVSRLAGKISLGTDESKGADGVVNTTRRLVLSVIMPDAICASVTSMMLQRCVDLLAQTTTESAENAVEVKLQSIIRLLATKYPTQMDAAINNILKGSSNPATFRFISKCFAGSRHQPVHIPITTTSQNTDNNNNTVSGSHPSYGSLLTCLDHPQVVIRRQAVEYVASQSVAKGLDVAERVHVTRALTHRLRDDDVEVVSGALSALSSYLVPKDAVIEDIELVDELRNLLLVCVYKNADSEIVKKAMSMLLRDFLLCYPQQLGIVAPHALSALFVTKDTAVAATVVDSLTDRKSVLKTSPYLVGFTQDMCKIYKTNDTVAINQTMVKTLSLEIQKSPLLGLQLLNLCEENGNIENPINGNAVDDEQLLATSVANVLQHKLKLLAMLVLVDAIPVLVSTSSDFVDKALRFINNELNAVSVAPTSIHPSTNKVATIPTLNTRADLTRAIMAELKLYAYNPLKSGREAHVQAIILCTLKCIITNTPLCATSIQREENGTMLLWRVFSLVSGTNVCQVSGAQHKTGFQALMTEIFIRVPAQAELLFISSSWLKTSLTSNSASPIVHVRALAIADAFLQSFVAMVHASPSPSTSRLLESVVVFVPSLLVVLMSSVQAVRKLALRCLRSIDRIFTRAVDSSLMPNYPGTNDIQKSLGTVTEDEVYQSLAATVFCGRAVESLKGAHAHQLVKEVVSHELEFQSDPRFLVRFVSQGYTNDLGEGESKKKKTGKRYVEGVSMFLASYACALANASQQSLLLIALAGLGNGSMVLPSAASLFTYLADKCRTDTPDMSVLVGPLPENKGGLKHRLTVAECEVLDILLHQYDTTIAPLLTLENDMTHHLMDTMRGFKGYTHGQMVSVRTITPEVFELMCVPVQREVVSVLSEVIQNRFNPNHTIAAAKVVLGALPLNYMHIKTEMERSEFVRLTDEEIKRGGAKKGSKSTTGLGKRARNDSESSVTAKAQGLQDGPVIPAENIRMLTTIIEVLQTKDDIEDEHMLLDSLFEVVERCIDVRPSGEGQFEVEYAKQVALCAIASVFERTTEDAKEAKDKAMLATIKKVVNVELIVQCVRMTDNPQTHHHALTLLAKVADVYPSLVLHNIMSIFTFMGTSVLRQDDNYSFHIIKQSIQTVIPPLIRSTTFTNDPIKSKVLVLEIVKVFVTAYQHMPQHRRLLLFTHLLTTIGVSEYLGLVTVMMLDAHALNEINKLNNHGDLVVHAKHCLSVTEFVAQLIAQFNTASQLSAFNVMVEMAGKIPNHRPETTNEKASWKRTHVIESTVCPLLTRSEIQIAKFKQLIMQVVTSILVSRSFSVSSSHAMQSVKKDQKLCIADGDAIMGVGREELSIEDQYQHLLENILTLTRLVTEHSTVLAKRKGSSKATPLTKTWKHVLDEAYKSMEAVNNLLPLRMFVEVVKKLIRFEDTTVRCKALRLFALKVEEFKTLEEQQKNENETVLEEPVRPHGDKKVNSARLFVGMVEDLVQLISDKNNNANSNSMKQSAMLNLEVLAHNFALTYPDQFVRALPVVVSPAVLCSDSIHLRASGFVCLGSLINTLGTKVMTKLPVFAPLILNALTTQIADVNYDPEQPKFTPASLLLIKSALVALTACLSVLPQFMSNRLGDILAIVCNEAFSDEGRNKAQTNDLITKISDLRAQIAAAIAPRVLLPALYTYYSQTSLDKNLDADASAYRIAATVRIVQDVVISMSPADVLTHYKSMFKLFLSVFDYTETCDSGVGVNGQMRSEWVDDAAVSSFVAMVMKLSESSFKPLFLTLVSWYTSSLKNHAQSLLRGQVFFMLLERLSSTLKTIFAPYVKHVATPMVSVLDAYNSTKDMSGNNLALFDGDVESTIVPGILVNILSSLHNFFLFDSSSPTTGSKQKKIGSHANTKSESASVFKEIHEAILDQLENDLGGEQAMQKRLQLLVQCIGQLAVTVSDDDMWKVLNNKLLLKTRHHETSVRTAALTVEKELYARLGEEFLLLLPETIPFLAEAMEDDSPEVEAEAQEVITTIESFLGESLQKYF
eukprot:CFRG6099T1